MDALNRDQLKALVEPRSGPCVSIYLPTHRAGAEIRQDPIRLKNLLKLAEERLAANGLRPVEVKPLLEPAYKLEKDQAFWREQVEGLAVFLSPEFFRYFRLPSRFDEAVRTGTRFYLKPLMPLLGGDRKFYVLGLSKNQVRLLRATRYSAEEIDLDSVPQGLADLLRSSGFVPELEYHTRTAGRASGDRAAIIHGHGAGGAEDEKTELFEYFRKVDSGLKEFFKDRTDALVLAGVEYLFPIFREANTYPYLLPGGIPGNPDGLKPGVLHQRAWAVVRSFYDRNREEAAARCRELLGSERASDDVRKIVPAAYHGRVSALFVREGAERWGRFDAASGEVALHEQVTPEDDDLLDFAAAQSFAQGGDVYVLPEAKMPSAAEAAAAFRY